MLINGTHYQSIEFVQDTDRHKAAIKILDQRKLPFEVIFETLQSADDVIEAIGDMHLRGAPLIGIAAAFGVVFACEEAESHEDGYIIKKAEEIIAARPTAVNAEFCVRFVLKQIESVSTVKEKKDKALKAVLKMMREDADVCKDIGRHGIEIIREMSRRKRGETVNILTHCNAGWLACMDYGTATSPLYLAKEEGINIHVWVDETRPRNQGARLTVWELSQNGIKNTLITDNAGGHLMQQGLVDLVIVGSDRTILNGDTANKIGTYLKALAAKDNEIPFWVAVPSSSIDWDENAGFLSIPIEKRSSSEIKTVEGLAGNEITSVLITGDDVLCFNPGFDVTPARLITGLITERGLCKPNRESICQLFPEKSKDLFSQG